LPVLCCDGLEESLIDDVKRSLPGFEIAAWRLLGEGWMSRALLLNDRYVFRFAKRHETGTDFAKERAVLPIVAERTTLALPHFEFEGVQANGLPFVAYPVLPGEPLPEDSTTALPERARERVAEQLARFMDELHGTPLEQLAGAPLETVDMPEDVRESARRWQAFRDRVPLRVWSYVDRRFDEYLSETAYHVYAPRFLHADLSPDHLLFDGHQLTGVIDFGDCEVGDPDYEYQYLLADMGLDFTRRVMELRREPNIEALLRKVSLFVTFDLAQAILGAERYGREAWIPESVAQLEAELNAKETGDPR
jgi:aminoglycoside 2''-phosphotransferase